MTNRDWKIVAGLVTTVLTVTGTSYAVYRNTLSSEMDATTRAQAALFNALARNTREQDAANAAMKVQLDTVLARFDTLQTRYDRLLRYARERTEQIARLEAQLDELRGANARLTTEVSQLRTQVRVLNDELGRLRRAGSGTIRARPSVSTVARPAPTLPIWPQGRVGWTPGPSPTPQTPSP